MFTRSYMTILWPSQHASGSISTCCVSQVQTLRRRLGRSTSSRVNGPWSRGNGTEVVLSDTHPTYPCQLMSIVLFVYINIYVCVCPYYLSSFFLSFYSHPIHVKNLESWIDLWKSGPSWQLLLLQLQQGASHQSQSSSRGSSWKRKVGDQKLFDDFWWCLPISAVCWLFLAMMADDYW